MPIPELLDPDIRLLAELFLEEPILEALHLKGL